MFEKKFMELLYKQNNDGIQVFFKQYPVSLDVYITAVLYLEALLSDMKKQIEDNKLQDYYEKIKKDFKMVKG